MAALDSTRRAMVLRRGVGHEFRLERAIEAGETSAPFSEGVDEKRLRRGHVEDFGGRAQRIRGFARRSEACEARGAEGGTRLAAARSSAIAAAIMRVQSALFAPPPISP